MKYEVWQDCFTGDYLLATFFDWEEAVEFASQGYGREVKSVKYT